MALTEDLLLAATATPQATLASLVFVVTFVYLVQSIISPFLGLGKTAFDVPSNMIPEKTAAPSPPPQELVGYDSMGSIEPLTDLDYKTVVPERIYKFADRYNLTMGLRKTTVNTITRIDQQYVERIGERKRILEQYPGALGCIPSGEPMVRDFYTFLVTHYLPKRYPTVFVLKESKTSSKNPKNAKPTKTLHNKILNEHLPLEPPSDIIDVLRIIALTVDEDFLMLQPDADGDGYALTAFVWMYPVGFDPVDKLGIKLRDAHGPVPGYKQHLQKSMERYFGRLGPGNVVDRINWAVATNASLCERGEYHLYEGDDKKEEDDASLQKDVDLDDTWVRCELQTLFALPRHDARILSVHLYLYPIREIKQVGLAEVMERAIDGYGKGNVPGFARYKRIPVWGEAVKRYLRSDEDLPEGMKKADDSAAE
ncbi:hypothetical protein SBRCBS47491_003381 [Sporothrix bragantina]|uniref:Uncharacterized protein n=1 Tax=Sporothrix bragantina TaxID=671064 RepID=A0ABP0BFQ9_9PEZI